MTMEREKQKEEGEPDHSRKQENGKRTYILTFDLGLKVQYLRQLGLKVPEPGDSFFVETEQELLSMFRRFFVDDGVIGLRIPDLAGEILSKAVNRQSSIRNAHVVSTCMEIADAKRGDTVNINRLIDAGGNIIGLGPRPGYAPLDKQVQGIAAKVNGDPIVLVEDGAFTGSTIVHLLDLFKQRQINVSAVVLGFAFERAIRQIRGSFDGEIDVVHKGDHYIDWMPDHDFFPFVPNCGRVIGMDWANRHYPFYSHQGATYSVPYLRTFCPMGSWTGIGELRHQDELSFYCVKRDLELFQRIEQMNRGKRLMVGDLISVEPKISIPQSVHFFDFVRLDVSVTSFLEKVKHMLE